MRSQTLPGQECCGWSTAGSRAPSRPAAPVGSASSGAVTPAGPHVPGGWAAPRLPAPPAAGPGPSVQALPGRAQRAVGLRRAPDLSRERRPPGLGSFPARPLPAAAAFPPSTPFADGGKETCVCAEMVGTQAHTRGTNTGDTHRHTASAGTHTPAGTRADFRPYILSPRHREHVFVCVNLWVLYSCVCCVSLCLCLCLCTGM